MAAAEKGELLRGAACLLNHPIAWSEPFGMVMVEALAHGTPVVATPRGLVPELVDDGVTGLVRATEPELADALADVPSLDRDSCRRAAAERFSTCRMVADHVALYRRLLGAESPGRAA